MNEFTYPAAGEIEEAFFQAMEAGYACADTKKTIIPEIPGLKMIVWRNGDYQVVDKWQTSPESNFSFGDTTVFYKGVAVWTMSYEGFYREEEILFLKRVLRNAYERRIFRGGRGDYSASEPNKGCVYFNSCHGDFLSFSGEESICCLGQQVGYHSYHGGLIWQCKKCLTCAGTLPFGHKGSYCNAHCQMLDRD